MGECLWNITLFWTNNRSVIIFYQKLLLLVENKKDTSEICSDVPLVMLYYFGLYFLIYRP